MGAGRAGAAALFGAGDPAAEQHHPADAGVGTGEHQEIGGAPARFRPRDAPMPHPFPTSGDTTHIT